MRQRIALVKPTPQIDRPATLAAERHRLGLDWLKLALADGTLHKGCRLLAVGCRPKRARPIQSFFAGGFFDSDFLSLLDLLSDFDSEDFDSVDFFSPDFLSFSAAFLYDSLR